MKRCKKCGGPLGGTHNGPANCIHGVSMKRHCCQCGELFVNAESTPLERLDIK